MSQLSKKETEKILHNTLRRVLKNRERFPYKDYYQIVKNSNFNLLLHTLAIDNKGYKLLYVDSRQLSLQNIPARGRISDKSGLTFEFKVHSKYSFILGVVCFYI